jgi:hypothetical protein
MNLSERKSLLTRTPDRAVYYFIVQGIAFNVLKISWELASLSHNMEKLPDHQKQRFETIKQNIISSNPFPMNK